MSYSFPEDRKFDTTPVRRQPLETVVTFLSRTAGYVFLAITTVGIAIVVL